MIHISRISTNQRIILGQEEYDKGIIEIDEVIKEEGDDNTDFGLLAPDFTITIDDKTYTLYDRGFLLVDTEVNKFWLFIYGNTWYNLLEEELDEILKKDPEYFLKGNKNEL